MYHSTFKSMAWGRNLLEEKQNPTKKLQHLRWLHFPLKEGNKGDEYGDGPAPLTTVDYKKLFLAKWTHDLE